MYTQEPTQLGLILHFQYTNLVTLCSFTPNRAACTKEERCGKRELQSSSLNIQWFDHLNIDSSSLTRQQITEQKCNNFIFFVRVSFGIYCSITRSYCIVVLLFRLFFSFYFCFDHFVVDLGD